MLVQLHDGQTGNVIAQTQSTIGSVLPGPFDYAFTVPPTPKVYYVTAAVERKQTASPSQIPVCPGSNNADFSIRGIPATINFTGAKAGTFILVSQSAAYAPLNPPTIKSGMATPYFSTVADANGSATLEVPAVTVPYYFVCWVPPAPNATSSAYTKVDPSSLPPASDLIGVLQPGNTPTVDSSACHQ